MSLKKDIRPISGRYCKTPGEVKAEIVRRGWKSVAGFQTRNPIHRAHEYLQKVAMNICDGIFIQPLVGWRRDGDFSVEAIVGSYDKMLDGFYPPARVIFGTLELPMLYAGPREAVLHALVRKNYGCTHFIIGRDHAGVGNHYHKYEAQDFAGSLSGLGIEILALKSPFYCKRCGDIATESICPHHADGAASTVEISGTVIRKNIKRFKSPPLFMMRPEISKFLIGLVRRRKAFNKNGSRI